MSAALVTGGDGQLGSDLREQLRAGSEVHVLSRAELDIADYAAVAEVVAELQPNVVFNCAAFHNVDVCEREEDRAFEVNARAVKRLAELSRDVGAKLVHFSTNYVFDGRAERPYTEEDVPNPQSAYAISKLAGEHAALAYGREPLVVRSAGLYGLHGSESKGGNFVQRVLARAREEGRVTMVSDQLLTPTYTADLAQAVIGASAAGTEGVLHLTNAGETSWYEFTLELMALTGIGADIEPVATTPRPGVAARPLNGLLASVRGTEAGGSMRPWQDALRDYVNRAGLVSGQ